MKHTRIKKWIKELRTTTSFQSLLSWLIYLLLKALFFTYRLRITYEHDMPIATHQQPGIFYFWHQGIISGMLFFSRTKHQGYCIVSPSKDGKIAGFLCKKLGFTVLYGSAHKNTISLLRQTFTVLDQHQQICLIGDGSRGPAFRLQPGIIHLAERTQLPLVFIECKPKKALTLSSWDHFHIPLPFSTIEVRIHQPVYPALDRHTEGS